MGLLGIDVGEKRTGVAATDSLGITVQPIDVFESAKAIDKIVALCIERNIEQIIIGMPYNAQGELGHSAKKVVIFREKLDKALKDSSLKCEIIYWDEVSSTKTANGWLREAGLSGKKRRKVIDKLAAVAILEDYLEAR